ncbi:MAG TPA: lamin tail domain-containing protein [Acidimicrobiia bacterium]|nr:lamin tail domain-containing protein [Acidimicrobiia bacterium]
MRRIFATVGAALLLGACGTSPNPITPDTPATTGPVTTGAVTTSRLTTSPATVTPIVVDGPRIPVEILDVFDGDSFAALVGGRTEDVRLEGINAPERDECFSGPARTALAAGLGDGAVSIVETGRDRFGRILAHVESGAGNLNLLQVAGGYAIATSFEHQARDAFLAAEESAFSRGLGLWAADACGPATAARVAVARVEADPPGPDEDRLLDEWIGLVNDGENDVDVGGWTIRDESSTHRYTFDAGAVIPAGGGVVLRTGCGDDGADEVHWCADGPVWSNGGDTVLVLDAAGNVVDRHRYGG